MKGVPLFVEALLLLASAVGCTLPTPTPSTTGSLEQPDDIVATPGGPAYRANVHGVGNGTTIPNPWPPVEQSEVALGTSPTALVTYRDRIETKPGQSRNNMFTLGLELANDSTTKQMTALVTVVDAPSGMTAATTAAYFGGPDPARLGHVVVTIVIPSGVAVGTYPIGYIVQINGRDYGRLPGTINVVN